MKLAVAGALAVLLAGTARGDIALFPLFSSHAVVQRSTSTPIWGTAAPGEEVAVTLNAASASATADADGKWKVALDLSREGAGPFDLVVKGTTQAVASDVMVGEVWFASGQSNMEFSLGQTVHADEDIAASNCPRVREFRVPKSASLLPSEACAGQWQVSGPTTSGAFSAVAYGFARRLEADLHEPIGIVHGSWGGTSVEAWIDGTTWAGVPALEARKQALTRDLAEWPARQKAFIEGFGAWLEKNGRQDKPCPDVDAYAAPGIPADTWTSVSLPGPISGPSLPASGTIWIRREVTIPSQTAGRDLRFNLQIIDGFDTVYWNGAQVAAFDLPHFRGGNLESQAFVPGAQVKEGPNTIAVRIFAPLAPIVLHGNAANLQIFSPLAIPLSGEWRAKVESTLPSLDADLAKTAPEIPAKPPEANAVASALFNGMIHPLLPCALAGVIWYQGENNTGRAWQYRETFPMLINGWRRAWGRDDLPFYFCQLPNDGAKSPVPGDNYWAELRESQSLALALPHTAMAVLIDLGEEDIHPRDKREVGARLARIALADTYGKAVCASGPLYEKMSREGATIRLFFQHADGGLHARPLPDTWQPRSGSPVTLPLARNSPGDELEGFMICGDDHRWEWAQARIDHDTVVAWSPDIADPVAIRYAWATNPTCNLYNGEGLPAAPFRTDDFPLTTRSASY